MSVKLGVVKKEEATDNREEINKIIQQSEQKQPQQQPQQRTFSVTVVAGEHLLAKFVVVSKSVVDVLTKVSRRMYGEEIMALPVLTVDIEEVEMIN